MRQNKITEVQNDLQQLGWDGWLFYDFRRSNELACDFLEISKHAFLTRRFFYWIPKVGEPVKVVHGVEQHMLDHLPGIKKIYRTWQELDVLLKDLLHGQRQVAMEYSPYNAIPYVSKVDAGTIEKLRAWGIDVVSSADLFQKYQCVWSQSQLQSHLKAADVLDKTAGKAWNFIGNSIKTNKVITEYDVQQFILSEITSQGCTMDGLPICAVNEHSADPHYSPEKESASLIKVGDFVLIDLWCKEKVEDAVYADITRVAKVGKAPTDSQNQVFNVVKESQEKATEFVRKRVEAGLPVMGFEVDDVARGVIAEAGFAEFFIHRTGHNIGIRDHGDGTNIDNFETQDRRHLIAGTCFSIEPGVYLPGEFGVRLEYDVYLGFDRVLMVTGGKQEEIVVV